jgi:hypothetical protein
MKNQAKNTLYTEDFAVVFAVNQSGFLVASGEKYESEEMRC